MASGMEVEFQITAIRCAACKHTEATVQDDDCAAFIQEHHAHCYLTLVATITAPPELVDGKSVEIEFLPEKPWSGSTS